MNKRLDDQIAQVAFGDVDAELATRIERLAQTDPEVRASLETYRAMRAGLREMSPAMDHQLSSDRLREEILRRGLEKRSGRFDWRWLFVPAAALGAYAFMALALRSAPPAAPVLVASTSGASKSTPEIDLPRWTAPAPNPEGMHVESAPEPKKTSSPTLVAEKKSAPRPVRESVVRADRTAEKIAMKDEGPRVLAASTMAPAPAGGGGFGGGADKPSPFDTGTALSEAAAPAAIESSRPEEGIVVIQPVRDAATGAYRATEVASPSNVLIGS
ncbi:MAG: hypothetical protein M9921_13480 [Fimbriimonadaceae bacterium]|nr:hypothetical protein [Fimbriimonadaceae bacterium]